MAKKKKKKKALSVAIIVDPMGSSMASAKEEVEEHKKSFTEKLEDFALTFTTPNYVSPELSADLVIYDFGGMMPGTSLMDDNSRAVVKWASDHQSALVVVASGHTFHVYVKPEMEALGLNKVKNIWDYYDDPKWDIDSRIAAWFGE